MSGPPAPRLRFASRLPPAEALPGGEDTDDVPHVFVYPAAAGAGAGCGPDPQPPAPDEEPGTQEGQP
jgi:hypothetical protein